MQRVDLMSRPALDDWYDFAAWYSDPTADPLAYEWSDALGWVDAVAAVNGNAAIVRVKSSSADPELPENVRSLLDWLVDEEIRAWLREAQ